MKTLGQLLTQKKAIAPNKAHDEIAEAQREYLKALNGLHLAYIRLHNAKQRANQR